MTRPCVRAALCSLAAATAVTAGPAALAGCGTARHTTSSPATTSTPLSVTPAHPTTRSAIAFAFTAPVSSGVHGAHEIDYSLSITGPAQPGCTSAHEAPAPSVRRGARATVDVGPRDLGGQWCAGRYTARAFELQRAHCRPSAPCPQYIRVVGIVARATFAVRRATGS